jgi:transcriptional regulator with XRE-family HTH domain
MSNIYPNERRGIMSTLGSKIKLARKEKGWTQKQLSDKNMSRSMISLVENDLTKPSLNTLKYIAAKLEKPLSYFLSESQYATIPYENLILELEELLLIEGYEEIIKKTEEFIARYKDIPHRSMDKRSLGNFYAILGVSYYRRDEQKAEEYFHQAVNVLQNITISRYLYLCLNHLGLIKYHQKNYSEMEKLLLKADSLLNIVTLNNVHSKVDILHNLALSYCAQYKFMESIKVIGSAQRYCYKYDFYINFGELNRIASMCYKNMNQLDDAILCSANALNYYLLSHNTTLLHRCYINLCILYRAKKDHHNALYYIGKAIRYFEETNNRPKLINSQVEKIITLFEFDSDPCSIRDLINLAIDIPDISDSCRGELLSILGMIELRRKNYSKALEFLRASEGLVTDEAQSDMSIFIYKGLQEVYEKGGDVKNSAVYKKKAGELLSLKPYYHNFLTE